MAIKLSSLAIVMGLVVTLINLYGVIKPGAFAASARKFPRSVPIGILLTLLGTGWFLLYLQSENISDFEAYKPLLYALFVGVGVGTCIFVQDFLAVRGFAVVLLLLAKLMLDTARWADSSWCVVIQLWAYVLIVAGIWFTVSPYRMRDLLNWANATEQRTRLLSGLRAAFGLFVTVLGLTAFSH